MESHVVGETLVNVMMHLAASCALARHTRKLAHTSARKERICIIMINYFTN